MAAKLGRDDTGRAEMVVLRTEDGAWYAVPIADLEWTRLTHPAQLAELGSQLAAGGGAAAAGEALPVALLSPETLARYRVDGERTAALEQNATAGADDVAGFTHGGIHPIGEDFVMAGNHRWWSVWKISTGIDGKGVGEKTLVLAPPPSVRFPGGFPGVA